MAMTLKARASKLCRQNGFLPPEEVKMKYDFPGVRIEARSEREYWSIIVSVQKKRRLMVAHRWRCSDGGVFEGSIILMDPDDYFMQAEMQRKETARLEDWWQRYHNADEETRSLMACGMIE